MAQINNYCIFFRNWSYVEWSLFFSETGAVLSEASKVIEEAKPLNPEQVRSGVNFSYGHFVIAKVSRGLG